MKAIGIDIGGTRIKSVITDADGRILQQDCTATNEAAGDEWKQTVKEITDAACGQYPGEVFVAGIAAPGLPDAANTAIACMPGRMPGLENFTWGSYLKIPALVLNDAVAAMVAEAKAGAAVNTQNAIMLTLGTGVGGAILINGQPYQGAFAKAGHFGHMVIDDEGDCDVTGMPGSLEECIGNCTIEKRSRGRFHSTDALLQAYKQGDVFAGDIWHKSVRRLALALASLTNILSPEIIVLGGGIAAADDNLFLPLEKYMRRYEWQAGGNKTVIKKAVLGDMAGAAGAAYYALQNIKS